jgi:hypothetical protein
MDEALVTRIAFVLADLYCWLIGVSPFPHWTFGLLVRLLVLLALIRVRDAERKSQTPVAYAMTHHRFHLTLNAGCSLAALMTVLTVGAFVELLVYVLSAGAEGGPVR